MSIETKDTIDLIGTDKETGEVMLTICDHLDWIDVNYHLTMLQDKVNCYLRFIESGEIYESYPDAYDKDVVIDVVCKYDLPAEAEDFLRTVKDIVEPTGIKIKSSTLCDPPAKTGYQGRLVNKKYYLSIINERVSHPRFSFLPRGNI